MPPPSDTTIDKRAKFDFVRYANCWEDTDILCEALEPAPGKRILSIASAGDNAIALAAEGAEVVAADLNPAQLACAELKCKAIQSLAHEEVLRFLGIRDTDDRLATYKKMRPHLTEESKAFWDSRTQTLETGFIHDGKFEKYFSLFRTRILPLVASEKKINGILAQQESATRKVFFSQEWDTWRWRALFKIFFSRFVMGKLGRDPEFFRYVEGSVSEKILARANYGLRDLPTDKNPYIRYILKGNYEDALPRYLRPEKYAQVQEGIARIQWVLSPIQNAARTFGEDSFDGYNLSDIFEYLSDDLSRSLYGELLKTARKGARIAYWNMLVPRHCPEQFAHSVLSLTELSEKLFARDKAIFYSNFVVDEVRQRIE